MRCKGLSLMRRWALSLCSRSSREGFSFLLPEQKKRNKENSPSALFGLLRHFSPLNKKNSLRSNSFLFFTLRKAPSLHGKKVRPDLTAFTQHRFACWGVMFSLASLVLFVQGNAMIFQLWSGSRRFFFLFLFLLCVQKEKENPAYLQNNPKEKTVY